MTISLPTLTQRLRPDVAVPVNDVVALTADERRRSRAHGQTQTGQAFYLHLPRGTVLHHGDILQSEAADWHIRVVAKPEPVLTITATTPIALLQAAYHLGNRHVPLEVAPTYLRLAPDEVLRVMLQQLGVAIAEEIAPFQPETGAYTHTHSDSPDSHT